jgi:hypothetical protein
VKQIWEWIKYKISKLNPTEGKDAEVLVNYGLSSTASCITLLKKSDLLSQYFTNADAEQIRSAFDSVDFTKVYKTLNDKLKTKHSNFFNNPFSSLIKKVKAMASLQQEIKKKNIEYRSMIAIKLEEHVENLQREYVMSVQKRIQSINTNPDEKQKYINLEGFKKLLSDHLSPLDFLKILKDFETQHNVTIDKLEEQKYLDSTKAFKELQNEILNGEKSISAFLEVLEDFETKHKMELNEEKRIFMDLFYEEMQMLQPQDDSNSYGLVQ